MRRINLDHETQGVQDFIRSLSVGAESTVIELHGRPVIRVTPLEGTEFDRDELKATLLRRRDASRQLNEEWLHADREVWNDPSDLQE